MKKLFSIMVILLMLGFCLGGPVLADDVRGTGLQLVVPEAPEPTPVPTAVPTPTPTAAPTPGPVATPTAATSNTNTGIAGFGTVQTAAVLSVVLSLTVFVLWRRSRKQ